MKQIELTSKFVLAALIATVVFSAMTVPSVVAQSTTSPPIRANSVTSGSIKDGEVKTNDLADNAVTSAKIAGGTIQEEDIADGVIPSGGVQPKVTTVEGPTVVVAGKTAEIAFGRELVFVDCPAGEIVTGGGFVISTISGSPDDNLLMTENFPHDEDTWAVGASYFGSGSKAFVPYAQCLDFTP
jgi:hypothetical protein